jgi:hypothetical protein
MKKIILTALIAAAAFACNRKPVEGVIVDKQHEKYYTITPAGKGMALVFHENFIIFVRDTGNCIHKVRVERNGFDTLVIGKKKYPK